MKNLTNISIDQAAKSGSISADKTMKKLAKKKKYATELIDFLNCLDPRKQKLNARIETADALREQLTAAKFAGKLKIANSLKTKLERVSKTIVFEQTHLKRHIEGTSMKLHNTELTIAALETYIEKLYIIN